MVVGADEGDIVGSNVEGVVVVVAVVKTGVVRHVRGENTAKSA